MLCDRFTIAFGTPEMLKSMFSSSIARLNLFAFDDVVSRCPGEPTSCTLCELASTGFPVRLVVATHKVTPVRAGDVFPVQCDKETFVQNDHAFKFALFFHNRQHDKQLPLFLLDVNVQRASCRRELPFNEPSQSVTE